MEPDLYSSLCRFGVVAELSTEMTYACLVRCGLLCEQKEVRFCQHIACLTVLIFIGSSVGPFIAKQWRNCLNWHVLVVTLQRHDSNVCRLERNCVENQSKLLLN
jgi:hypothetical protein